MDRVMLGNEAIAYGLLAGGVEVVCSYPGTPSSEILPSLVEQAREHGINVYAEWSVNEKVAFETAFAAAISGKRAAVVMKQVGLNVAADPLLSALYTGTRGGFLVVCADDPGPWSSQTEQDTRAFARFAKVPVLDPATPREACDLARSGLDLSESFLTPVVLRPSLRVCHARECLELPAIVRYKRQANFQKQPDRWAATPKHRFKLHVELNAKLEKIARHFDERPDLVWEEAGCGTTGIVAGGVLRGMALDYLESRGIRPPVLHVAAPYPFPAEKVGEFVRRMDRVLVLEEPDRLIEDLVSDRVKVMGRSNGVVPEAGELDGEVLGGILDSVFGLARTAPFEAPAEYVKGPKRPTLCPGCPHRNTFYAIRKAFPKGIYASDIGCYTLGINLRAVDSVLDMGASIPMASGFYRAHSADGNDIPVIATIGDSTFFHSGMTGLVNAVYTGSRIVVVVMDNAVTAMTGMQPAISKGLAADGSMGRAVPLEKAVEGCGVAFIRVVDPYDVPSTVSALREAYSHTRDPEGGPAVVVARHPCVIHDRKEAVPERIPVAVDGEKCRSCGLCLRDFECPALFKGRDGKTAIQESLCAECGRCVEVCPFDAFVVQSPGEGGGA